MAEKPIQANVTADKSYVVVCPTCKASKTCQLSDLPPNHPNPFYYVCPCGVPSSVLLNYRKTPRKPVKLMGTVTVPSEPKKIERIAEIQDISDNGMRVMTEFFKTAAKGQYLIAKVKLDDPKRSKLDVPCIVRNLRQDNMRLTFGVEFVDLDESSRQVMRFYMMSVELEIQK